VPFSSKAKQYKKFFFGLIDTPKDLNPQDLKTRKREAVGCPVAVYRHMDLNVSNVCGFPIYHSLEHYKLLPFVHIVFMGFVRRS
jgi:hypothetical protein